MGIGEVKGTHGSFAGGLCLLGHGRVRHLEREGRPSCLAGQMGFRLLGLGEGGAQELGSRDEANVAQQGGTQAQALRVGAR